MTSSLCDSFNLFSASLSNGSNVLAALEFVPISVIWAIAPAVLNSQEYNGKPNSFLTSNANHLPPLLERNPLRKLYGKQIRNEICDSCRTCWPPAFPVLYENLTGVGNSGIRKRTMA